MNPATKQRLMDSDFVLNPIDVGVQIFFLLLVPLLLGMGTNMKLTWLADRLRKFFKVFSMLVFGVIVFGALAKNWTPFKAHAGQVVGIVVFHNALGYLLGYLGASLHGLAESDRRAVTIEVGIQNSALALLLIVNNFPAEVRGGMMMVAAMWGIWHNISGLSLAWFWARKGLPANDPLYQEA
jgi:BASS family bile acid:Na+ symporter